MYALALQYQTGCLATAFVFAEHLFAEHLSPIAWATPAHLEHSSAVHSAMLTHLNHSVHANRCAAKASPLTQPWGRLALPSA